MMKSTTILSQGQLQLRKKLTLGTWNIRSIVAAVSYLLTFQSTAGRTWCILISLNCCQSDVSRATGGLADGYNVIYTGCVFSVGGQS